MIGVGICFNSNFSFLHMSHRMGKPTICIGENKGADQLRSNCEADQRLCFRLIALFSLSKCLSLFCLMLKCSTLWLPYNFSTLHLKFSYYNDIMSIINAYLQNFRITMPQFPIKSDLAIFYIWVYIPQTEPRHEKTNNVVFEQVHHKLTCTVTEAG